jgi:hypothetical protein
MNTHTPNSAPRFALSVSPLHVCTVAPVRRPELHLYYRVFHDIVEWAIADGYREFRSGSFNYDPKWHLRQSLDPIDL